MRRFGKFLSMLLVLALVFSFPVNTAKAADGAYTGKTIILHSNDVHGEVEGYAAMKALKDRFEAQGASEVILVDAGDFSQGTVYVSTSKGKSATKLMNKAGYLFTTLGNHEFDYGYAQLKKNAKNLKATILCANILDEKTGKPAFTARKTYKTKSGVKIGFFGINTPESQTKANPALIKGLKWLAGDKMCKAAQEQVTALRKTDVVICLAHCGVDEESKGNQSYDLYHGTKGIDLIIDGHSHTVMTKGVNGERIQSTGTAFANIGVVVIDDVQKRIVDNYLVALGETLPDSTETADIRISFNGKAGGVLNAAKNIKTEIDTALGEVFAKSEVELNGDKAPGNRTMETNLGDLITDSMVWKVLQNKDGLTVDADKVVAITNGGGIRAWMHAGDITQKDVNTVLPFGNTICLFYLSGAEILEALEASTYCTPDAVGGFSQVSGIKYTVDTSKKFDAGELYSGSTYARPNSINRVTIQSINGKKFNKKTTYAVVVPDFCVAGGDTYGVFPGHEYFDTGITLDSALVEYISTELNGVVGKKYAEPAGRITIK